MKAKSVTFDAASTAFLVTDLSCLSPKNEMDTYSCRRASYYLPDSTSLGGTNGEQWAEVAGEEL